MRVAALYDIHGNLSALEAVLAELRDAVVVRIGDAADVVNEEIVTAGRIFRRRILGDVLW